MSWYNLNMCYIFLDLVDPQETDAFWNHRHGDLFCSSQQGKIKEYSILGEVFKIFHHTICIPTQSPDYLGKQ